MGKCVVDGAGTCLLETTVGLCSHSAVLIHSRTGKAWNRPLLGSLALNESKQQLFSLSLGQSQMLRHKTCGLQCHGGSVQFILL